MEGRTVFCEACGQSLPVPRCRTVHLLCPCCQVQPRQYPDDSRKRPATLRELWGLREEPRDRMLGETWR